MRLYGRCLDVFPWLECFGRSEDLVPRHLVRYYYLFLFCFGGRTHTNHALPPPPSVIQHPRKPYGHQVRYLCDWSSGGFIVIQVGITDLQTDTVLFNFTSCRSVLLTFRLTFFVWMFLFWSAKSHQNRTLEASWGVLGAS